MTSTTLSVAFSLFGSTLLPSLSRASAGTSGGDILNIPVGARAIAMGEAFTAQADDVSSLYWNPAGIAIMNQSQASFMYNQFLKDQTYNNAAVAVPLENGGIGGSLSYLSFGSIKGYDDHGVPTSDVNAYSGVGTVGGGWLLGPLSLGANVKAVQAKLADVSATGVAADVGGIWTLQKEVYGGTLRSGFSVRNMGTGLKFIDQRDPFPLEWRLGVAAVQMAQHKLNLSLDYGQERDVRGAIYTGAEYWVIPMLAFRLGYAGTSQEGNGIRAGLGLRINDFSFDYAYSGYSDLGLSHRYEMSFHFGAPRPLLTPEERALYKRAKLALSRQDYDQAVLLFDSLIVMEPRFRPPYRYMKTAMRGVEGQEAIAGAPLMVNPLAKKLLEPDQETNEIADLLSQSEGVRTVQAPSNNAETNALAPLIPSDDSTELILEPKP